MINIIRPYVTVSGQTFGNIIAPSFSFKSEGVRKIFHEAHIFLEFNLKVNKIV